MGKKMPISQSDAGKAAKSNCALPETTQTRLWRQENEPKETVGNPNLKNLCTETGKNSAAQWKVFNSTLLFLKQLKDGTTDKGRAQTGAKKQAGAENAGKAEQYRASKSARWMDGWMAS